MRLGQPRLHLRATGSTNDEARGLAARGAPHGTLVTATQQTAGRGRQGRAWAAPAGRALLCSLVLRDPGELISLAAGVAVADLVGAQAALKWPNDVLVDGRKVAGILVEGRPQEGWAVLGIGINVALRSQDFPPELRERAGTLGREVADIEPALVTLLDALERWLSAPCADVLEAVRARDALLGRPVRWGGGSGVGAGVDDHGRLRVRTGTETVALDAGEVHLGDAPGE
ncbi:MAG: BirA family transcriptional regulator [Solirubrobacteraceae bacterium]|nr:BirA family transcriptional regulator [Solirubrobacteraceae bacterium]